MFVKIAKGRRILRVTQHQYEKMYKNLGYQILGEDIQQKEEEQKEEEQKEIETEEIQTESEDIESIPISEMSKQQLQEYAKKHKIDTRHARNVTEARKIIQRAVREANM